MRTIRGYTDSMMPTDIEIMARQSYDRIASTYYSLANPTTRLFDLIIADYLTRSPPTIRPNGSYIEVGAGKTKIGAFMEGMKAQIILLDLSERMLQHSLNDRKSYMDFLVGSAFRLPFRPRSFSGGYSFLGDPFTTEAYFSEAFRILKTGAEFIHVLPNQLWAKTLRTKIGISLNSTIFPYDGDTVSVPSFVLSDDELIHQMRSIGFSGCRVEDLFVPRNISELPEHVLIPSKELGQDAHEIPILTVVRARR